MRSINTRDVTTFLSLHSVLLHKPVESRSIKGDRPYRGVWLKLDVCFSCITSPGFAWQVLELHNLAIFYIRVVIFRGTRSVRLTCRKLRNAVGGLRFYRWLCLNNGKGGGLTKVTCLIKVNLWSEFAETPVLRVLRQTLSERILKCIFFY